MNRKLLTLIFLLSCVVGWRAYLADLGNSYIVSDDARLVLLGVLRFFEPNLFPDYLIADYAEYFVTPGVRVLYWLSFGLIDPIAFGKIISFGLFVIATIFFLKLMYAVTNSKVSSVLAVLFFVSISTFKSDIAGGFPRSFSTVLTILFLYFLIKKAWIKVFATLTLSSLLHPITFLLCYVAFLFDSISVGKRLISIDKEKKRIIVLLAAILLGALVLVPQHIFNNSPQIGTTMNRSIATSEAVYYEGGRPGNVSLPTLNPIKATYQQLITPFALNSKAKILDKKGFSTEKAIVTKIAFVLILLSIFIANKCGFKIIPKALICYFLSGLTLYLIADALFIKLYFPKRYLSDFSLISLVVVYSVLGLLFKWLETIRARFVFFIVIAFMGLTIFLNFDFSKSISMKNYSYDRPILKHISAFSEDVVVAAYPMGIADNIPLFSKRKVFVFYEASNPFHVTYWHWVKKRTIAFFDAYYDDDLMNIERFMELNKVDYLLVDMNHFEKDFLEKSNGRIYFEPFSTHISKKIKSSNSFALKKISPDDRDFQWGNKYIISREKIKTIIEHSNSEGVDRY